MPDTTADLLRSRIWFPKLGFEGLLEKWRHGGWHAEHAPLSRFGKRFEIEGLQTVGACAQHSKFVSAFYAAGEHNVLTTLHRVAEQAATLFQLGFSIQVGNVHQRFREVGVIANALAAELGLPSSRVGTRAIYSPPGEEHAYGWHFDCFDNLVVQLRGSKTWTVAPNRDLRAPVHAGSMGAGVGVWNKSAAAPVGARFEAEPLAEFSYGPSEWSAQTFTKTEQVVARPGSALFVSRGTWHRTGPVGPEGSLSLAFEFRPFPWYNVVQQALEGELITDDKWRASALGLLASGPLHAASLAELDALLADLRERLARLDAAGMGRTLSRGIVLGSGRTEPTGEAVYARSEGTRLELTTRGKRSCVVIRRGREKAYVPIPETSLALARWIERSEGGPFTLAEALASFPSIPVRAGRALIDSLTAEDGLVRVGGTSTPRTKKRGNRGAAPRRAPTRPRSARSRS